MDLKRIASAAALTVAMSAPAFAEPVARSASAQDRLQKEQTYRYRQGTGFWPVDAAAGIVGGAIGTAGAIAAAPFGGGPYAYYNGPYVGSGYPYYAASNGFACVPGKRFRGEDGLIHRCR
jgi:hypothetical protein